MQTTYYTTRNFIRHSGKVIDLSEYRRRLETVGRPRVEFVPSQTSGAPRTKEKPIDRRLLLDYAASLAIVVLAVTVTVSFLTVL